MFQFLIYVLNLLISLYAGIMLIYCLCTWFIRDPGNKFMRILATITEPPLYPIKGFLARFEFFRNSPVDFSPLILFLLLRVVVSLLSRFAYFL